MWKDIWDLFVAFFTSSILSYGGGPASIPLMRGKVVETYKWFTNEQFTDALAVTNALPGPVAPKMAAYVGSRVAGAMGAVVGVAATVVPTAVAVVFLGGLILAHRDSERIQGMLRVAKPMVVVLLLHTAFTMMTRETYPNVSAFIVSGVALALVLLLKVDPAIVVITGLVLGFALPQFF